MKGVEGVILCGGKGKRLRPLTYYFQKTMIPIGRRQKPLLEYIVRLMKYHGIEKLTLLVNYKYEQILNYFETGDRFGVKIEYSVDDPKLAGTGGALLNAYRRGFLDSAETILIYYGDILTNLSLSDLVNKHLERDATATLAVATRYQVPVGVAEVEGDKIVKLIEKPWMQLYVTMGILTIDSAALKTLDKMVGEEGKIDIMGDFIPKLIEDGGRVYAYKFEGEWYDVGSAEKYEKLDPAKIDSLLGYLF
ncbi:MAG: nucleotidyltransferase family protein [Thermoproteales archaeon]|nr:nucleotidyltransferase family protein [Thermoproteales archaeon]